MLRNSRGFRRFIRSLYFRGFRGERASFRRLFRHSGRTGEFIIKLLHGLRTVFAPYRQSVHDRPLHLLRDRNAQFAERLDAVRTDGKIHRVCGLPAGDQRVHRRAHRINIRIWSLPALRRVLLDRGKARRHHCRIGFGYIFRNESSRGTEIEQDQPVFTAFRVFFQVDIVRLDITVDQMLPVKFFHLEDQRLEQGNHLFPGHPASLFGKGRGEVFAFDVVHHNIGRAVFLKKIADMHNVRAVKLRECPGFCLELLAAFFEAFLSRLRGHRSHMDRIRRAHRHTGREILLDRCTHRKRQVDPQIGDPESALSEHFSDKILPVKDRTFRKCVFRIPPDAAVIAAIRADGLVRLQPAHAVKAVIELGKF